MLQQIDKRRNELKQEQINNIQSKKKDAQAQFEVVNAQYEHTKIELYKCNCELQRLQRLKRRSFSSSTRSCEKKVSGPVSTSRTFWTPWRRRSASWKSPSQVWTLRRTRAMERIHRRTKASILMRFILFVILVNRK